MQGNIRVFCRIRPLLGEEITNNGNSEEIYHLNVLSECSLELLKDGASELLDKKKKKKKKKKKTHVTTNLLPPCIAILFNHF